MWSQVYCAVPACYHSISFLTASCSVPFMAFQSTHTSAHPASLESFMLNTGPCHKLMTASVTAPCSLQGLWHKEIPAASSTVQRWGMKHPNSFMRSAGLGHKAPQQLHTQRRVLAYWQSGSFVLCAALWHKGSGSFLRAACSAQSFSTKHSPYNLPQLPWDILAQHCSC